ncbi:MAG: hypothetical protein R3E95_00935 [Thiolinea sp.]
MAWYMEHPAERVAMGLAARQRVENCFNEQQVLERLGLLYQTCGQQRENRRLRLPAALLETAP